MISVVSATSSIPWITNFFLFKKLFYTIFQGTSPYSYYKIIGYITRVVQYMLEPILNPVACTSYSPHPCIAQHPTPHW